MAGQNEIEAAELREIITRLESLHSRMSMDLEPKKSPLLSIKENKLGVQVGPKEFIGLKANVLRLAIGDYLEETEGVTTTQAGSLTTGPLAAVQKFSAINHDLGVRTDRHGFLRSYRGNKKKHQYGSYKLNPRLLEPLGSLSDARREGRLAKAAKAPTDTLFHTLRSLSFFSYGHRRIVESAKLLKQCGPVQGWISTENAIDLATLDESLGRSACLTDLQIRRLQEQEVRSIDLPKSVILHALRLSGEAHRTIRSWIAENATQAGCYRNFLYPSVAQYLETVPGKDAVLRDFVPADDRPVFDEIITLLTDRLSRNRPELTFGKMQTEVASLFRDDPHADLFGRRILRNEEQLFVPEVGDRLARKLQKHATPSGRPSEELSFDEGWMGPSEKFPIKEVDDKIDRYKRRELRRRRKQS